MVRLLQCVSALLVHLVFSKRLVVQGSKWEIKSPSSGESYSPPRLAISLQDHTAAFASSAYCVNDASDDDKDAAPQIVGYTRSLCQECPSCVWKLREGFTTEPEWQAAVSNELARLLEGGGVDEEELVGTWIAEAPIFSMNFTDTLLDNLASSLGVSIDKAMIVSENGDRGYFVVSGTPSSMDGMWSAGFKSLTPIPPSLKVDPMLVEEAAAAAAATAASVASTNGQLGSSSYNKNEYNARGDLGVNADDAVHSLHVQIFERPVAVSSSYSSNHTVTAGSTPPHRSAAQLLSTAWTGMIATRLGHGKAEVMADGEHHVSVRGLTSTDELYRVALDIAAHGEVHWVAPQGRLTSSNYFASQVVQSGSWYMPSENGAPREAETIDKYSPFSLLGLTGKGQVVGVADTGLDWNSGYFMDENITPEFYWSAEMRVENRQKHKYEIWASKKHRKIRQYVAYMNAEEDEAEGHGTHISGSIAGAPPKDDVFNAHYHGVAPDAKIAFFDRYSKSEENGGYRLPANVGKYVFPHAYKVGARVYVASFNFGHRNPAYSAMAKSMDKYCFNNRDFIVLVSAGNTKSMETRSTLFSPAEAKNAITVGSHFNPVMAEVATGAPETPAKLMGVNRNSGCGPTRDGRIKPDVVGPGSRVYSAASSLTAPPGHCSSVYKDGTSSANAVVAGAAVLARQYFTDGYYPTGVKTKKKMFKPMGALLKAVLVNSARAVGGGSEYTVDVPNQAQGWGGVNLASTLVTPSSPKGLQLKVYGKWSPVGCPTCPRVSEDIGNEYRLETSADTHGLPLKVTLVWYDPPGASSSRKVLVNDLDLTVTEKGPRGGTEPVARLFFPNGRRTCCDRVNTVEHIQITDPKPSTMYTVRVLAHVIPYDGTQTFALVISGPFDRSNVRAIGALRSSR